MSRLHREYLCCLGWVGELHGRKTPVTRKAPHQTQVLIYHAQPFPAQGDRQSIPKSRFLPQKLSNDHGLVAQDEIRHDIELNIAYHRSNTCGYN